MVLCNAMISVLYVMGFIQLLHYTQGSVRSSVDNATSQAHASVDLLLHLQIHKVYLVYSSADVGSKTLTSLILHVSNNFIRMSFIEVNHLDSTTSSVHSHEVMKM